MLNPQNLKKNIANALTTKLNYNQPFLQSSDCNSSAFLREISYKVNLAELYKVVGTCYISAQMEYCPILLKVINKVLVKELECDYLLQVWNKEGKMVFERRLKNPISIWAISSEFFIYKPQLGDDNFNCFHVTDLKNGNSTLLIKDPINNSSFSHLAYYDGILYIANNTEIYLLQANLKDLAIGEQKLVDLDRHQIEKIVPGVQIHALFNIKININRFFWKQPVVVAMETADNQIDFSQIIPQNFGTTEFEYILKQQRDIVSRSVTMDPIAKFSYITDEKNMFYGVSLRKSGKFDVYWNMTLVDSPQKDFAADVDVSFDSLFVKMRDGQIKSIDTEAGPSVNFEQSADENEEFEFPIIFYQNIKNHVNLYNSFTLVRTTLYIVHGQFVSLYNIQENQWLKHCKFYEGKIAKLFEKFTMKTKTGKLEHELAVLLENGSIYDNIKTVFFNQNQEDQGQGKLTGIDASYRTFQIKGRIIRTAQDQQNNEWFYIMSKEDETHIKLFTLHHDSLFEITLNSGLMKELDEFTYFIHLFCPSEISYLVIQKDIDIVLYQISIEKAMLNMIDPDYGDQKAPDFVKLNCIINQKVPSITGNVHSCISLNINDHLFFVDGSHFYRYQCTTKMTKVYRDQNCVGLYVVDDKFCYSLSHSSKGKSSGLRLYDINNILTKDTDVSYKLSNVQVGFNGFLDWNQDYFRFSILKSLDTLIIVPALHRNTIAFIGMGQRETYLATKVIKDKFIALDNKNHIFTWSIVTGKLLSVHKIPMRQDYSDFMIFQSPIEKDESSCYKREWYQKILLVKNKPEENFDETAFYNEDGQTNSIKNQLLFGQTQKREFREYRLIEIMNEAEVKEHLTFIHPFYQSDKQRIYFDDKNEYMLEKLGHPRVFLYEREETKRGRKTRWRCIRRLNKFPEQLENDSGFLTTFSPSFKCYIDINRRLNQFVIRDTLTANEMWRMPKHLFNLTDEQPSTIMNRFKWINDDQIRIINKEGIEKILNLKQGYKEVEYNMIPLFDQTEIKNPLRSFYHNRSPLAVSEVKDRLVRKYQQYKSAYYLDHMREPISLYDKLFTVDYQVDNCRGMHVADIGFTFLHWKIMEQLETRTLAIELIDDQQIELLFYNILPGGNTILHKLSTNSGDVIKKIMMIAHPDEENFSNIAIHIPFLQNLQHKSPMHICQEHQDIRTMDTMLTYLAGYGVDHHSRAIIDMIPCCIEKQLPSLLPYLNSRLQQTEALSKINKGCLKDPSKAITEMSLWFGQEEFDKRLLKQRVEGDDTLIDRPIRVEFVDIPNVYHYDDCLTDNFFGQLADTDQYEIFQNKAIQKLIEFNYPLVKIWTITKLQIPFMCFQVSLFVYLNFVFGYDNIIAKTVSFPMQIVLGFFACYFLRNEIQQMRDDGIAYFSSIWNYIDMITPSTVLTVLLINSLNLNIGQEYERILQAIGVFFMWFKFLYFFRIFKSFGYLIRLIILVIADMKDFLIVLFFTLVAFGDTFLTISNGNKEGAGEPFVFGFFDAIIYTYLIILGSFEMSHFQNSMASSLLIGFFIMCTLFNTIVMLNLLIAIISETFSQFKENSLSATYQEMAAMIAENSYLIPDHIKQKYAQKNKYLMVVTDLEAEMEENSDEVLMRLDQLKKNLMTKIEKMTKTVNGIKKKKKKQHQWQEKQDNYNQMILTMLKSVPGVENNLKQLELETPRTGMAGRFTMSQRANSRTNLLKKSFQNAFQPPSPAQVKESFRVLAETLKKLRQSNNLT